jgi:predicted lipid-binding transport protein (Tim44 family)
MSDIFDLTNLLLLAVAVAIFLRLRSVLGRRTGDEQPRLDRYAARDAAAPARDSNVVPMPRAGTIPSGGQPTIQSVDDRVGALPAISTAKDTDPGRNSSRPFSITFILSVPSRENAHLLRT